MKKMTNRLVAAAICLWLLPGCVYAERYLIPVGQVVGLELRGESVTVAAFDDRLGAAAREAGLRVGDEILEINGTAIDEAEDVRAALDRANGSVRMRVLRAGKECRLSLKPEITEEGPKLGIYLRQGITGIGTVTWYDPETGAFGALGHGVSDGKGQLASMTEGNAYEAGVLSVKRGKTGQPGQLRGGVEDPSPIGSLDKNTAFGVFGSTEKGWAGKALEIAEADEIHTGAATICATVMGTAVREYSVEILKLYPNAKYQGRNLLLRITDPALLQITGGIVQGMSGSPIIQDGKLVGAVTHVLVNDPTTGYGIFIENMLDAAA